MWLSGKVALITGASKGIGHACAEAFIREGAAVALVDIDAEAGTRAAEQLSSASDREVFFQTDVADPRAVESAVEHTILEQVSYWQPLGPLGSVKDIVSAAVFLGSDESPFITGVVLPIDGGWTVQ